MWHYPRLVLTESLRSRILRSGVVIGLGTASIAFLAPEPDFVVALIPDTQHYTMLPADTTYASQMRWLRDSAVARRIAFAIHLGDVTEEHERVRHEWPMADEAHRILDASNIPYSIVPGNHDYPKPSGKPLRRNLLFYNLYFGPGRFAGRPWYIGSYPPSTNANSATVFDASGLKFMVVGLEYAPTKDAMCWADSTIKANPDRRVIVATHCYLSDTIPTRTICASESTYSIVGADGPDIWEELLSRHSNVVLTLAGHVNGAQYFRSLRSDGKAAPADAPPDSVVTEILTDYQTEPPVPELNAIKAGSWDKKDERWEHGNGWLRMLRFVPAENRLYATPQSTRKDVTKFTASLGYPADPASSPHTFDVPFDLSKWNANQYRYEVRSPSFVDRTVNAVSDGNQVGPEIGMRSNGDFVIVWRDSSRVPGHSHDVRMRAFHHHGCQRLPERRVNGIAPGPQSAPVIGIESQGRHVVAWQDDADGNDRWEIRARGYSPTGSTVFEDIRVNAVSTGHQRRPSVAVDASGNSVIVWEDDSNKNDKMQIRARGFAADGTPRFTQRTVNVVNTGQQQRPVVAMTAAGDFVVVWQDDSEPPHGVFNVFARVYRPDGTPRTAPFRVNANASGQQRRPAVALSQSQFLVAWEDSVSRAEGVNVRIRGFDLDGTETIVEQLATQTTSGPQRAPAVAVDQAGTFFIAWEDDRNSRGGNQIYAAAIRAGTVASEITVNSNNVGTHRRPAVAASASTVVVAWEGDLEKNGRWEIMARGLSPNRF